MFPDPGGIYVHLSPLFFRKLCTYSIYQPIFYIYYFMYFNNYRWAGSPFSAEYSSVFIGQHVCPFRFICFWPILPNTNSAISFICLFILIELRDMLLPATTFVYSRKLPKNTCNYAAYWISFQNYGLKCLRLLSSSSKCFYFFMVCSDWNVELQLI